MMNRPFGWEPAPWSKWDRAEREREEEQEAAIRAEEQAARSEELRRAGVKWAP